MVVREVVAERFAGLKKRIPVETPVIDAISLPAEIVSSVAIPLGKVDGIIPIIARGKAYGEVAGRWYRVNFARALPDAQVVAVAEGRAGEIPTPKAPSITIPRTKIPEFTIPYVNESFPYFVSDSERIQEQVCDPLNRLTRSLYGIQDRINDAIGAINDGFSKTRRVIDEQRSNIEAAVNDGLANVLPLLYNAWGIPKNMAVTPLHVRNVTSTGFDFQSYGKTTCRYIAVGSLR